jgi:hypothetical protein
MAKPKLCLIPATIGDKVYSILPSNGVGDFDFTRATTATRINAQGLIEEVASGENRLNYSLLDGKVVGCPHLLLEPSRTNTITHSNDFSQSIYGKINLTITANQGISPDGTQNANLLVPNAAVGNRYLTNTTGSNLKINTVFLKKKELRYVKVGNSQSNVLVDLENGTISAGSVSTNNFTIENYGNGWYRVSCYNTLDVNLQIQIFIGIDGSGSNIATNGTDGVYIYGFEIQNGSYPTSYIKTNGSAVTRAAETCNGSGDAATFNDSEGVLFANIAALADDGTYRIISLSNGNVDNSTNIQYSGVSNQIRARIENGGLPQADITSTVTSQTLFHKIAVLYKSNQFELWSNGFKVGEDTNGTPPSGINKLSFDRADGINDFYGKTKEIGYYDATLTDSELEYLTSYRSLNELVTELNLNTL